MTPRIATLHSVTDEVDAPQEFSIADRARQLPPAQSSDPVIYWEFQGRDRLCGLHCLNTLIQGPVFTEVDLSTVALQLDEEERKLVYASTDTEVSDLLAGGSANVADDGFFSISVLEKCLSRHLISIRPSGALPHLVRSPTNAEAFVCHHHNHWLTLRKLHGKWYNLDSLRPAPTRIGEMNLRLFLSQLIEQGYSVFIVASMLPNKPLPMAFNSRDRLLNYNQLYLTDKQMDALVQLDESYHQKTLEEETSKYGGGNKSDQTVSSEQHSWPTEGGRRINDSAIEESNVPLEIDDPSLQEAIKLSLAEFTNTLPRPPPEPEVNEINAVTLQVRLPNSEKLIRRFKDTDTIESVFHWLEFEALGVISVNTSYQLVASYPRRLLHRIGRTDVEYQTSDNQIHTNYKNKELRDVVTAKQDSFILQVI